MVWSQDRKGASPELPDLLTRTASNVSRLTFTKPRATRSAYWDIMEHRETAIRARKFVENFGSWHGRRSRCQIGAMPEFRGTFFEVQKLKKRSAVNAKAWWAHQGSNLGPDESHLQAALIQRAFRHVHVSSSIEITMEFSFVGIQGGRESHGRSTSMLRTLRRETLPRTSSSTSRIEWDRCYRE